MFNRWQIEFRSCCDLNATSRARFGILEIVERNWLLCDIESSHSCSCKNNSYEFFGNRDSRIKEKVFLLGIQFIFCNHLLNLSSKYQPRESQLRTAKFLSFFLFSARAGFPTFKTSTRPIVCQWQPPKAIHLPMKRLHVPPFSYFPSSLEDDVLHSPVYCVTWLWGYFGADIGSSLLWIGRGIWLKLSLI